MPESLFYKINAPKVVYEVYDGEIIFMNLGNGNYYNVTGTAAAVCNLVIREYSIGEIISNLVLRYNGSGETIGLTVRQFLADLDKEGILIQAEPVIKSTSWDEPEMGHIQAGSVKPLFEIPVLNCYTDMQQLILLDPVHEVGDEGWPNTKTDQKPPL